MLLKSIRTRNFRNFEENHIDFESGINCFIGENGQGKTNLIESIYYLSISRSFRTSDDSSLIMLGCAGFELHGEFIAESGVMHQVSVLYAAKRKKIALDTKRLKKHSSLIGLAPMVLFCPEHHRITGGTPSERRLFLDILLSQAEPQYLGKLQDYAKTLRQRNRLLGLIAESAAESSQLEPWDEAIAKIGFDLCQYRQTFISKIRNELNEVYGEISGCLGSLEPRYRFAEGREIDCAAAYLKALRALQAREIIRRQTLIGPHRDDLSFVLNNRDVRKHASRGEQKSVLLALKIVEYRYIKKAKKITPVLLLDDIFSELDQSRQINLISAITDLGQSFITSTSQEHPLLKNAPSYQVKNGKVRRFG